MSTVFRSLATVLCSRLPWAVVIAAAATWPTRSAHGGEGKAASPEFERDVWPIFVAHCTSCHGADEPKAGLDVRTVASLFRGGDSGPALNRSDSSASLLEKKISQGEMPPEGEQRLSAAEVSLIRAWALAGAPAQNTDVVPPAISPIRDTDRQFWSFRPLGKPALPVTADSRHVRTPVDSFLLAKLEARGLTFSADADSTTLVRRTYLDLLGLPPSPEDIDAFMADDRSGAFERLLDRLLASQHYGERWGRHWLDVAGYVDTVGFDTDATNIIQSDGKWRYRDYVIQAFNSDKPYDRFITEQLAGDELYDWRRADRYTPEMLEGLIATGYLRTARDLTHEDVGVIQQNFFGIMHDTLETVGTGLLGLTLNCARCHNHKFDPLPQEDYYRLMAILTPAYNPRSWLPVIPYEPKVQDRALADLGRADQAEVQAHNSEINLRIKPLREMLAELRRPYEARLFEAKLATLPEPIRADAKGALDTSSDKRTEVQKYLADKLGASLKVKSEEVNAAMSEPDKAASKELDAQIAAIERGRRKWGKIQALYDVGSPPATHLLLRGSETTPGPEVVPGFLRVLSRTDDEALASPDPPCDGTSGRRKAFARWLTDSESPAAALVARVMVNRVWQQLFGRGIVPTPDNFGAQGQPPTHPELLEWLSAEFIAGGWRVKPLVRLMMASTAYRQASHRNDDRAARDVANRPATDPTIVDPGNELLWRTRLRRLESEAVRDSILAVSGKLDRSMGGPPILISARPDGLVVVAQEKLAQPQDEFRRSVYLMSRRAYNLSLLTVFDQPLVATNCTKRDASAVPLQSLVMLNDGFMFAQAEHFASRVEQMAATTSDARIITAFRLALARDPDSVAMATCRELLEQQARLRTSAGDSAASAAHQALVELCHTLFNTSEFLYVE
jgi:mono/diheme cytochrome c family protein